MSIFALCTGWSDRHCTMRDCGGFALRAALVFGYAQFPEDPAQFEFLMANHIPRNQMNADQLRQELTNMENEGIALMARFLDYAGQDRIHPVDLMVRECAGLQNADHRSAIVGLLRAKRARLCFMCSGRGHWADKCPLRKEIDRAFRNTPVMASWSQVKTAAFRH